MIKTKIKTFHFQTAFTNVKHITSEKDKEINSWIERNNVIIISFQSNFYIESRDDIRHSITVLQYAECSKRELLTERK